MVLSVIDMYDDPGKDATLAHYKTRESDGPEWCVFVFDEHKAATSCTPSPTSAARN